MFKIKQRFSIRKLTIGAVSVLLGLTFINQAQSVSAAESTTDQIGGVNGSLSTSTDKTVDNNSNENSTDKNTDNTNQPQDLNSKNLASASTYTLGDGNRRYPSADKDPNNANNYVTLQDISERYVQTGGTLAANEKRWRIVWNSNVNNSTKTDEQWFSIMMTKNVKIKGGANDVTIQVNGGPTDRQTWQQVQFDIDKGPTILHNSNELSDEYRDYFLHDKKQNGHYYNGSDPEALEMWTHINLPTFSYANYGRANLDRQTTLNHLFYDNNWFPASIRNRTAYEWDDALEFGGNWITRYKHNDGTTQNGPLINLDLNSDDNKNVKYLGDIYTFHYQSANTYYLGGTKRVQMDFTTVVDPSVTDVPETRLIAGYKAGAAGSDFRRAQENNHLVDNQTYKLIVNETSQRTDKKIPANTFKVAGPDNISKDYTHAELNRTSNSQEFNYYTDKIDSVTQQNILNALKISTDSQDGVAISDPVIDAANKTVTYNVVYTDTAAKKTTHIVFKDGDTPVKTVDISGKPGDKVPVSEKDQKIPDGYEIEEGSPKVPTEVNFPDDGTTPEDTVIKLTHKTTTVNPDDPKTPEDTLPENPKVHYPGGVSEKDLNKIVTRKIYEVDPVTKEKVLVKTQEAKLTRTATIDQVTGKVTKYSEWTTGTWESYTASEKTGYTPDQSTVSEVTVNGDTEDTEVVINYVKNPAGKVIFKDGDTPVKTVTVPGKPGESVKVPDTTIPEGYELVPGQEVPTTIDFPDDGSNPTDEVVKVQPKTPTEKTTHIVFKDGDTPVKTVEVSGKPGDKVPVSSENQKIPDGYELVPGEKVPTEVDFPSDGSTPTETVVKVQKKTSDKEKYNPEPSPTPITTTVGKLPDPSKGVSSEKPLPDGTTYTWDENDKPDVSKPGKTSGTVVVHYPDGTEDKVPNVPVTVTDETSTTHIVFKDGDTPVKTVDISGKPGDKVPVSEKGQKIPDGYELVPGQEVPTEVDFPSDGSTPTESVFKIKKKTPETPSTETTTHIVFKDGDKPVKTVEVSGKPGEKVPVSSEDQKIPDGYELVPGQEVPTEVDFPSDGSTPTETVVKVQSKTPDTPSTETTTHIVFKDGDKPIKTVEVSGKPGDKVPVSTEDQKIPDGYELVPGEKVPTEVDFPSDGSNPTDKVVKIQPKNPVKDDHGTTVIPVPETKDNKGNDDSGKSIPTPTPITTTVGKLPDPGKAVKSDKPIPEGTTFTWDDKDKPDVTQPGKTSGTVIVHYPDGTKEYIKNVPVIVKPKATNTEENSKSTRKNSKHNPKHTSENIRPISITEKSNGVAKSQDNPNGLNGQKSLPQTGEKQNLLSALGLAFLGMTGLLFIAKKKKKD